jgi:tripartite-type tricarboxylate transporter receptor subunit TctC
MTTRRPISRRALLQGAAAAFAAGPAFAQNAAGWPDRNLRIVVPYPAGGSVDVLIRLIAERLKDKLGQPIVIENRPGAGGNTGIDAVAKSAPDGYTLGAATVGHFAINPFLYSRMPFDPERDIIPVSLTWELPNVAVVSSQHVPARTLQEFIDWAKAREGGIAFGSPGVGTSPHLSGVLFTNRIGIKSVHVPFRGAAQTIPAMLSGDVTFAIDNLASYMSIIESGQMRALAVTSSQRWPTMPNVPTMAEAGVPDFVVTSWAVLVAPSGTPRPIIDRLSKAMQEIAAEPAIQSRFLAAGGKIMSSTPEAASQYANREREMWREVVRLSGARAD